jgi:hypothetical protein
VRLPHSMGRRKDSAKNHGSRKREEETHSVQSTGKGALRQEQNPASRKVSLTFVPGLCSKLQEQHGRLTCPQSFPG